MNIIPPSLLLALCCSCAAGQATNTRIEPWGPVAPTGDTFIAMFIFRGSHYTSSDSAAPWGAPKKSRLVNVEITASQDKRKIVVVPEGGPIYASTNYGVSWVHYSKPGQYSFPICFNSDGMGFSATVTLSPQDPTEFAGTPAKCQALAESWYAVAADKDGSKIVLTGGATPPAPALTITPAAGEVILAWPATFNGFVLQRNNDLTTTNWVDVTNSPATVNGHHQVHEPSQSPGNFYRLARP